jgi:O-antigen/teichoic acid export membrane protein
MSADHNFRRSVSWLFLGSTSTQLLTFAFGIVLARLLAPAEFGMLVTIQVYTGLAGFVSGGGMGQALVRAKDTKRSDYDVVFTLQFLIGLLIYSVFFFAAPWFARFYDTPLYEQLLRVSALTFILRPLVNLPNSILYRHMRFKAQTVARVATLLVSSFVSIGLAWKGHGVWSLTFGGLAGVATNATALAMLARWRPGLNFEFARGRELARYGFLVSVNDIVVYARSQMSNLIIGRTLNMSAVGVFNKADSLMRMPHSFITIPVYQVLFRALAKEQDDDLNSQRMFLQSLRLVAVYCTPCYVLLYWLATPMIGLLYGPRWMEAAAPLSLLALTGPLMMVGNLSGAVLAARNHLDRELKVQVVLVILTAVATLAGLEYGLSGIASALIVVALYNALNMYWLAARCIGTTWKDLADALGPAALLNMLLLLWLTALDHLLGARLAHSDLLQLLVLGGLAGIAYAMLFLLIPLRSLADERRKWLAKLRLADLFRLKR